MRQYITSRHRDLEMEACNIFAVKYNLIKSDRLHRQRMEPLLCSRPCSPMQGRESRRNELITSDGIASQPKRLSPLRACGRALQIRTCSTKRLGAHAVDVVIRSATSRGRASYPSAAVQSYTALCGRTEWPRIKIMIWRVLSLHPLISGPLPADMSGRGVLIRVLGAGSLVTTYRSTVPRRLPRVTLTESPYSTARVNLTPAPGVPAPGGRRGPMPRRSRRVSAPDVQSGGAGPLAPGLPGSERYSDSDSDAISQWRLHCPCRRLAWQPCHGAAGCRAPPGRPWAGIS